jgi:hypothetical protein
MDYIGRAERAIRTGQPNLAMLYMRRALSECTEGRAWLFWYDVNLDAQRVAAAIAKHVQPFQDALAGFALAGPAKGAP